MLIAFHLRLKLVVRYGNNASLAVQLDNWVIYFLHGYNRMLLLYRVDNRTINGFRHAWLSGANDGEFPIKSFQLLLKPQAQILK